MKETKDRLKIKCGWLCWETTAIVPAKGKEALFPGRDSGDGKG